jgi:hypothetical protein
MALHGVALKNVVFLMKMFALVFSVLRALFYAKRSGI